MILQKSLKESKKKFLKEIDLLSEMFNYVLNDLDLASDQVSWLLQGRIEKYRMMMIHPKNFNFYSFEFPINIMPFIKDRNFKKIGYRFIYFFNILIFIISVTTDLKSHKFAFHFKKISSFEIKFLNLYFIYFEIKKIQKSFKNFNKTPLTSDNNIVIDDLKINLQERVNLSQLILDSKIRVEVHGGGYFVYKNIADIFFFSKGIDSVLKEDRFFSLVNSHQNRRVKTKRNLSLGFAPYFFDKQNLYHCGQKVLGIYENKDFFKTLYKKCVETNQFLVIRDPSKASKSLFFGKLNNSQKIMTFDFGKIKKSNEDSKKNDWSKDFIDTDIVYIGSFFTLAMQHLLANKPFIALVSKENFYSIFNKEVSSLIEKGIFIENFNKALFFESHEQIYDWWKETKYLRLEFIDKYFQILNSFEGGLRNLESCQERVKTIYNTF